MTLSFWVSQISWVRKRDWNILTHGTVAFTSDHRFRLVKDEGDDDWALQIKKVAPADSGAYECQVEYSVANLLLAPFGGFTGCFAARKTCHRRRGVVGSNSAAIDCEWLFQVTTDDGIQSRLSKLTVVTPEAFILAEEEHHIHRGSSLSLVCIIEKATTPPQ